MFNNRKYFIFGAGGMAAFLAASLLFLAGTPAQSLRTDSGQVTNSQAPTLSTVTVSLTDAQIKSVRVITVEKKAFAEQRKAVGYVDFNQDRTVQVFSPWAGRIRQVFVKAGDTVKVGESLFSIDSPDLVQAESNLIGAAGVLQLTTRALERARKMIETQANAQKDLDQAISDEQAAQANYRAARDSLHIFGKSTEDLDAVVASRKTDGELQIASPLSGRVTARSAAPGLLTQPGNAPAPVTVADVSGKWIVASVSEYDLPLIHIGQETEVLVLAYPGRRYRAKVTNIASAVDPATHRIAVRSEIKDPGDELRPQMLAEIVVQTGTAQTSIAVPVAGIVREGDGTMTAFVMRGGNRFERRAVQVGATQEGLIQVLDGLVPGEQVASDGALFLSNALALQTR